MSKTHRRQGWLWMAMTAAAAVSGLAASSALAQPAATAPATRPASLPHISVDRQRRVVDLEATVTMREGKWLELLACSPQTRQHESVLTTPAKPSHVHLALLTLGLQPGRPFRGERVGDEVRLVMPTGAPVAVSIVTRQDGREVEAPANEWIMDHNTGKTLAGNVWLFTGSEMVEYDGQATYRADPNGTVISLVNFGDDLLARQTDRTKDNDAQAWGPHTERIPPLGTAVLIRLRPAPAAAATRGAATAPATPTR